MPTPYTSPLTNAQLTALESTTLGNLKPYQLLQVLETLDRANWERGSASDVSSQPTISAIVTALNGLNP